MSAHVSYETPNDVADKIYEMVSANKNGKMKKGSNEVTKTAERGTAKFIIMAEDVNPPELLAHIPLICAEKGIPFGYVPSQEFLAKEAGMPVILLEDGYTEKNTSEIYHNHLIRDFVGIEKIVLKYL